MKNLLSLVSISLLLLTLRAAAFSPHVEVVVPRGGQKGTEVPVTFIGDRLYEPEEILFYQKGISAKDLAKGKDHKSVNATFVIAPDAPLGEYSFRLRTKGGLSYLRTFWVGQFPVVDEARDSENKRDLNDTFEEPQNIPMNVTVHGTALREDADFYRVEAKKGQRLSVEVEGLRLGRMLFDPYVAILDKNRFEIAANDDSTLLRRDCASSVLIPEDGPYTILVRESAYEGENKCQYRLHVGDFPRPVSVFPPAGKPGEQIEFTFTGDASGPIKQSVTLPGEDVSIHAGSGVVSPSGLPIRVSPLPYLNEAEPNESLKTSIPLQNPPAIPIAFQGTLSHDKDVDYFRFSAKKGQNLRARVLARSQRSPLDSVISIRSLKDNKAIADNDDETQGTPDSRVDFTIPEDGEYALRIRDQLGRSGPDFVYRIEIAPREPSLSVSLRPADRNDSQKYKMIAVPRGNRLIVVPGINRSNIGCAVDLSHTGLPVGVEMIAPHAPRNINDFPILFEAAHDAPLAGQLCQFPVKDPKSGLTGYFTEQIDHVAVNNLGIFHSFNTERIAVAVIEEAPFTLDLFIPPVPLVPNGTTNLKITATRKEGFDEKIRLTFPWKPPGVNAPNSIDIPKGQNEVILTLNANGDAPTGDWQVGVTATAPAKNGRGEIRLSTPLRPLKVGEPYLGMSLQMAATQPGQNTQVIANIENLKSFDGEAEVRLHALPHGTSSKPVKIKSDTKEIAIPVEVTGEAKKGKHGNLFCQVIVIENGHPISHNLGHGGTLRIDPPPPAPKKPVEKPAPAVANVEPKKPETKKPLSRLEQLRQAKSK
ncbi:MAG: pre-peptidase C-terminal domain-containing protein [Verrucomicrobiaceae bacterium]